MENERGLATIELRPHSTCARTVANHGARDVESDLAAVEAIRQAGVFLDRCEPALFRGRLVGDRFCGGPSLDRIRWTYLVVPQTRFQLDIRKPRRLSRQPASLG